MFGQVTFFLLSKLTKVLKLLYILSLKIMKMRKGIDSRCITLPYERSSPKTTRFVIPQKQLHPHFGSDFFEICTNFSMVISNGPIKKIV